MTTTDLMTVKHGTALANVPEYLKDQVGNKAGLEDVGREDVLIPRLCISQGLSPEVTKGDPKFIKGLETGNYFNSVTSRIYGEKVTLVPLFFFKQFIEFAPRSQGGGVVAMYSNQAEVPVEDLQFRDAADPKDRKPKVTEFKNEMCLIITDDGFMEPIVVSFKSTGTKTAKKWNALMRQLNLPAYARSYELSITTEKNTEGSWFGTNVTPASFVPEEFFKQAEAYFSQLREAGVKVHTEGMDVEAAQSKEDLPF